MFNQGYFMEKENLEENIQEFNLTPDNINEVIDEEIISDENDSNNENKTLFTIKDMLEAGVHFGHRTMRWNAKMAPYIYGSRNNIHKI